MPMVGKKKFPYTKEGKKEAKEYSMKTKSPMKQVKEKKVKRGY
jgi:hypothetical protein